MGFFNKPTPAPAPTASGLAESLSTQLERNAEKLEQRKDQALSAFRQTVANLRYINKTLAMDVDTCQKMIETATKRKADAEQAIADNEKVCAHILEIIGDDPNMLYEPSDEDTAYEG